MTLLLYLTIAVLSGSGQCACFGRAVAVSLDVRIAIVASLLFLHCIAIGHHATRLQHDA
jgi:hypothetical protein